MTSSQTPGLCPTATARNGGCRRRGRCCFCHAAGARTCRGHLADPGSPLFPGSGESFLEGLDLVALVFEKACEDVFEGALPVAEPEAVLRWDRVQLGVAQLGDPPERITGG